MAIPNKSKKFPPKLPSQKLLTEIINGFVADLDFDTFDEAGCAVCGELVLKTQMELLDTSEIDLTPLMRPEVTKKERHSECDPYDTLEGPVLAPNCTHICNTCSKQLKKKVLPIKALANELWVEEVPQVLKDLTWTEQLMISRVMHNQCVVKVSVSGMRKMKANAICHAVPIPKVYQALPPARAELQEVLAFIYIGPNVPTNEDFKRTPMLVRKTRVLAALKWLKLNHTDYYDIDISYKNLAEYTDDEPPVVVEFTANHGTNKEVESAAINDNSEDHGTNNGPCPFTVNTLTEDQLINMMHKNPGKVKAIAVKHFKANKKILGIGHSGDIQSLYNNPQLYSQMFPWLFPYGLGGLGNSFRQNIKFSDGAHKKHLLMYYDKRFQMDWCFPLIAFNQEQIKNASLGGHLYTEKSNFESVANRILSSNPEVLSVLIDKLEHGTTFKPSTPAEKLWFKILKDLDYVDAKVEGSLTNKRYMRNQIWSLMYYLGAPSWFITFAPSDVDHPIALHYADGTEAIYPKFRTRDEKKVLIANNPVAGARFFKKMVELFITHVLGCGTDHDGLYGKTAGYYGTVEQQGRLTLHLHSLLWIKDSLSPQEIRDRVLDPNSDFQKKMVEYLESVSKGEFFEGTLQDHQQQRLREKIMNPQKVKLKEQLPEMAISPCVDECQSCKQCKKSEAWWKHYYEEVDELIASVNVHDCNKNLECKSSKRGCVGRFPRDTFAETTFDPETGRINLRKGESMVNNYSPVMSWLMRCNTDLTSLLSGTTIKAVIAYVTDYITKPGLKTHTIFEAVKTVFKRESEILNGTMESFTKARKLIVKTVNALTGKSEIGGPMASLYLLKHKDHYTSHTFIPSTGIHMLD